MTLQDKLNPFHSEGQNYELFCLLGVLMMSCFFLGLYLTDALAS